MRERYQSMTTADGWIICGKCGHKLARVLCDIKSHNTTHTSRSGAIIELKCQSCKALNVYGGKSDGEV